LNFTTTLTERLSSITYESLDHEVLHLAKRGIVDFFGVTIGGVDEHEAVSAKSVLLQDSGKSSVLATKGRYNILNVALINGIQGHILDYDDTHEETAIHVTTPCLAAALALAEDRNLSGKELITAYVTGFEATVILGKIVNPTHYDHGWHSTGTIGTYGAAIAASTLLGFDKGQIEKVLGLCTTQLAGLRSVFGSSGKSLNAGKAAYNGLLAALLVEGGFDGPHNMLERPYGFVEAFSSIKPTNIPDIDFNSYKIFENSVKAYACGLLTHGSIDAVLTVKDTYGLESKDIKSLEFYIHPLSEDHKGIVGIVNPETPLQGKFSLRFCAAASLVVGKPLNSLFNQEAIDNAEVRRIMGAIKVIVDPNCRKTGATLYAETVDGKKIEQKILSCKGTPGNPMSDEELIEKFVDLTKNKLGQKQNDLLTILWNIENYNVNDVTEKLSEIIDSQNKQAI
jgi:2-methylcitrate dehydratase PrpD